MEFKLEEIKQEKKFAPMKLEIEIRTENDLKYIKWLFGRGATDSNGVSTYPIFRVLENKLDELKIND